MITKICGLSDPESIRQIAELKPSMMGFIFYAPSPRNACALLPSIVDSITSDIDRVGVFVDMPVDHVLHTASRYGLSVAQLHGAESPDVCRQLKDSGLKVMKAIGINKDVDWTTLKKYEDCIDMFVFDTLTAVHGGSGRKFDWNLLEGYTLDIPFLLSGGIGPNDISAVNEAFHSLPLMAGVDLNSRFETYPGSKDTTLIKDFVTQLHSKS